MIRSGKTPPMAALSFIAVIIAFLAIRHDIFRAFHFYQCLQGSSKHCICDFGKLSAQLTIPQGLLCRQHTDNAEIPFLSEHIQPLFKRTAAANLSTPFYPVLLENRSIVISRDIDIVRVSITQHIICLPVFVHPARLRNILYIFYK